MTDLRWFDDPTAFRARVEPWLLADEPRNNLMFGLLSGIAAGRWKDPLLCTLDDGDEVTVAALRTPPHNLLVATPDPAAAGTLANELHDAGLRLPGVNGTAAESRAFADVWCARTGATAEQTMSLRIYALTSVRPPDPVEGRARWATPADEHLVVSWLEAFVAEALPHEASDAEARRRQARFHIESDDAGLLLWEAGGEVVSFAGHSGPTPNGMRIGPVYTPPDARGRGYASACVAELSAQLLARGRRFCFLFTDLANPTSNKIYQRIGYEPVTDSAMYRFVP